MKYVKYLLIIACTLFICSFDVNAAKSSSCPTADAKDLAKAASYVKVDYEVADNSQIKELTIDDDVTTYKIPNYTFDITIYNLTDQLYATVIADTGGSDSRTFNVFYAETTNGQYSFKDTNMGTIYNYSITIRSNNEKCMGTQLRTIKFTKPRYNAYSEFTYCQNSSSYYCQRFIKTELNLADAKDFKSKIKVNSSKGNPDREEIEEKQEILDLLKKYWRLYLIILLGITGGVAGGIVLIKRHRMKKGWKL